LTGTLGGTAATFSGTITAQSSAGSGLRMYGSSGTNQWDIYLNSTNLRISDNTGTGNIVFDRPLNGTTASFTGLVTINSDSGGSALRLIGRSAGDSSAIRFFANNNSSQNARIESNSSEFEINSISNLPITFKTNDTTRLTIANSGAATFSGALNGTSGTFSGNVGIGTAASSSALTVNGQVNVVNLGLQGFYQARTSDTAGAGVFGGNSFVLRNGATSEDLCFDVFNRSTSVWYTPVTIKNTGNLLVGTTTDAGARLQVHGADGTSYLKITSTVATTGGRIGYNGDELRIDQQQNADLTLRTNGSERMRITSSGNVGIGTASPSRNLHVLGGSGVGTVLKLEGGSGATTYLQLSYNGATNAQSGYIGYDTSSNMPFFTNDTERMRITSGGNVGIGTASPASPIHVQRSDDGTIGTPASPIHVQRSDDGTIGTFRGTSDAQLLLKIAGGNLIYDSSNGNASHVWQSNTAERMRITSGGSILFGTQTMSTTHAYFDNAGSSRMVLNLGSSVTTNANLIAFNNPNGNVGTIATSGSSTSYNTTSDYRLKENVNPVQNALSVLTQLKPCTFNFIADAEEEVMGFIAHEVQEIVPQAVTGEKDAIRIQQVEVSPAELDEGGNIITEAVIEEKEVPVYQGIDHSKLVPLLVASIQELKAEIEALKSQING